ncbi:MAG: hypothetical protein WCA23_12120, partial [Stellaceae bacterium]
MINMSSNVALMGLPGAIATPQQRAGSPQSPVRSLLLMPHNELRSANPLLGNRLRPLVCNDFSTAGLLLGADR